MKKKWRGGIGEIYFDIYLEGFLYIDNKSPITTITSTMFQISLPRAILKNG
jgi:hypothetical protein